MLDLQKVLFLLVQKSTRYIQETIKQVVEKVYMYIYHWNVSGKKKHKWREEIWNIKYLSKFKWAHLNERLAYEKAVHTQRMRAEISQAKREANFYIQNAERTERLAKHGKKKGKMKMSEHSEETDQTVEQDENERIYTVRLKDTEEEIVKKKRGTGDKDVKGGKRKVAKTDTKSDVTGSTKKKAFLTKIFAGGFDSGDENN